MPYLILLLLAFQFGLSAAPDQSKCYRQIGLHFFDDQNVKMAMSLHPEINQGQWIPIVNQLRQKKRLIPNLLKKRAEASASNPFSYPYNHEEAMNILFSTLYDIFQQVMFDNYVTNVVIINEMFEYLKSQQLISSRNCLGLESDLTP